MYKISYRELIKSNIIDTILSTLFLIVPIIDYIIGIRKIGLFGTIVVTVTIIILYLDTRGRIGKQSVDVSLQYGYKSKITYGGKEIPVIFTTLYSYSFVISHSIIPKLIIVISENDSPYGIFHELGHYINKDPLEVIITIIIGISSISFAMLYYENLFMGVCIYITILLFLLYIKHHNEIEADKFMLKFIDCEDYKKFIYETTGILYEQVKTPKTNFEKLKHKIIGILLGHVTIEYRYMMYEKCLNKSMK